MRKKLAMSITLLVALTQIAHARASAPVAASFANYSAPDGWTWSHFAGETSIGVNPATDAAMFQMFADTARVTWDDTQSPPSATWTNVSPLQTSAITLDPILWTDQTTGRTFVNQLAGEASVLAFTDDDGETWQTAQPPSAAPAFDHETIGGGPYSGGAASLNGYPNVIYYCAQLQLGSECARSDTGGLTWGPPVPMQVNKCTGIHGHLVVGPSGTAAVPHRNCTGLHGVVLTRDNGLTWTVSRINGMPGAATKSDPKLAFDKAGKMYFVGSIGTSQTRKPLVSVSTDDGVTWSAPVNVGASLGIQNAEFPMVVGGDAGRAAVAFYGSKTAGDDQSTNYLGEWHLYVATTIDAGATWSTVDATGDDPIQRGCIWLTGGQTAPCRNLLDFQDMTIDGKGRVLVGYADGCTSIDCVGPNGTPEMSTDSLGKIARQTGGSRLIAAFDP